MFTFSRVRFHRNSFDFIGIISLATFFLWMTFVQSLPEEHPLISEAELAYILSTRGDGKGVTRENDQNPPVPWRAILTSVPVSFWAFPDLSNVSRFNRYTKTKQGGNEWKE